MPIALKYPQPSYPYEFGFADVISVTQNLAAGSWDPNKPGAYPTTAMVQDWLRKGTAFIDSELATRGYTIPLTAQAGYTVPTGFVAINGLHPAVYQILEMVCAAYATHFVEASRHGGKAVDADTNATHWMAIFDDFITRIATGADNLTAFGVAGPFAPEIDPAKGMSTGALGMMVNSDPPTDRTMEGPQFTKWTQW